MNERRIPVPAAVVDIVRTLEDAGHETWTVGGAIRDILLGRRAGDWDLTTQASPGRVRKLFRRTVPVGIAHGTVGVLTPDGTMYEVTTFRKDVDTDGRHAVVEFSDRLVDDLARRDFTINAIAWHPLREELFDPYDGACDLRDGVLRTVGDPVERFREDYLRILRALRFSGRFGLDIDGPTWSALVGAAPRLVELSVERIRDELLKVLDGDPMPSVTLDLYVESGALAVLHPEVAAQASEPDWSVRMDSVDHLPMGRPFLRLTALLHGLSGKEAAQMLVRLRLSNLQTDTVARRVEAPDLPGPSARDSDIRRWLSVVGRRHVEAVARVSLARARVGAGADPRDVVDAWRRVKAVFRTGPPLAVGDLALGGRDLMRLGIKPGPAYKGIFARLLDVVLEDPSQNVPETLEAEVGRFMEEGHV